MQIVMKGKGLKDSSSESVDRPIAEETSHGICIKIDFPCRTRQLVLSMTDSEACLLLCCLLQMDKVKEVAKRNGYLK